MAPGELLTEGDYPGHLDSPATIGAVVGRLLRGHMIQSIPLKYWPGKIAPNYRGSPTIHEERLISVEVNLS